MKAVNVETAEVIYGKVMTSGLGEIFDIVSREATVFASVITGDDTGRVSISTVPRMLIFILTVHLQGNHLL